MNKGYIVVIVIVLLIIAGISLYGVDNYRVGKNLSPLFCIKIKEYDDGNNLLQGILYRVIEYKHRDGSATYEIGFLDLNYNQENVK